MFRRLSIALMTLFVVGFAATARPQQVRLPAAIAQGPSMGNIPVTYGDQVQRDQARAANIQRQEDVRRDTEKMLQLTGELKDYLQKNDDVMSVDALKKAEQIEKLAHTVKSKMKLLY